MDKKNTNRLISIRSLRFGVPPKVVVVSPHPDDFDAIGVTLRFLRKNGAELRVGVVRGGSGIEDSYCNPPALELKERIREREQRESCRFFGLPENSLTFLELEQDSEAQPVVSPTNETRLAEFILPERPDMVFLPHGNDTNSGHRAIYAMVSKILERTRFPTLVFLNKDPKTISIRVDAYMPFGADDAAWKAQLLRFHDSQQQRNLNTRGHGFDERILATNRLIAQELEIEADYAEAFELESYPDESPRLQLIANSSV